MSPPPILVSFGSHRGMLDGIETRDEANLVELVRLKHNIRVHPNDFVRNGNQMKKKIEELYNKNGKEKFVYFVGHGNERGELCFDEGENFSLENLPFTSHDATIRIRLFMCYQREAHEALERFKGQLQQVSLLPQFTYGEQLTQDMRDQINETIRNYMLHLSSQRIHTEKTFGTKLFGHFDLYYELQREKEKKKERQSSSRSPSPVNQSSGYSLLSWCSVM